MSPLDIFSRLSWVFAFWTKKEPPSGKADQPFTPAGPIDEQIDCLLFQQPLEILLLIAEACPPESAAALSLTCRCAYILLFQDANTALNSNRCTLESFLLFLEEDMRDRFIYCRKCTQLHPLRSAIASSSKHLNLCERLTGYKLPRCYPMPKVNDKSGIRLPFNYLHLLMHVHHLGLSAEETRLLKGLTQHHLLRSPRHPWKPSWTLTTTPRIIHDSLFVRTKREIHLDGTAWENYFNLRAYFGCHLCAHITTPVRSHLARRGTTQLDKLLPALFALDDFERGGSGRFVPQNYQTGCASCRVCMADFVVAVRRRQLWRHADPKQVLSITILAYHQFGECRSPADWMWRTATYTYRRPWLQTALENREHFGEKHPPGTISRRWTLGSAIP